MSELTPTALWEYEKRHGKFPEGQEEQIKEMTDIAEDLRVKLGVNGKVVKQVNPDLIEYVSLSYVLPSFRTLPSPHGTRAEIHSHLSRHAAHFFPPTLAVLGGLVAQDVLRALSKRGVPFVNLLTVDSMGGTATVLKWHMGDVAA